LLPLRPSTEELSVRLCRKRSSSGQAPYLRCLKRVALTPVISLGRFWSTPERIASVFPIDGRELADLGLPEAQVLHCETAAFRLILSTV